MVTKRAGGRTSRSRPARIASVCVAGRPVRRLSQNENRTELLSKVVREIARRGWTDLDALLFPAGYFKLDAWLGPQAPDVRHSMLQLSDELSVCRAAAKKLQRRSPGCLVVVGVDGTKPDRVWSGDQLVVAFSPDAPVGWARKVFASDRDTNGEERHPYLLFRDDFGDRNRFVTLANGEVACLNACYDAFAFSELASGPTRKRRGLRYLANERSYEDLWSDDVAYLMRRLKANIERHSPTVNLVAIHGFERPGSEVLWQRHGLATASAAISGGLTVGAAHFTETLPSGNDAPLAAFGVRPEHLDLGCERPACAHSPLDVFDVALPWDARQRAVVRLFEGSAPEPARVRHVVQSNRTSGCGPAVIATAAGVSEAEAIRALFGQDQTHSLWTDWGDLRRALGMLGIELTARVRRVQTWSAVRDLAIVGVGKAGQARGSAVHWVIYDPAAELIYDPGKAEPVAASDTRRPPLSYLSIPRPTA